MTPYHVLVTDPLHPAGLEVLAQAAGITFTAPGKMNRAAALAHIPEAHALILRSGTRADRELIHAGQRLRAICRAGAGVDNVDLEAAAARGIGVMNTPGANTTAAAELTLGLMLALARHIAPASASVGAGRWERKAYTGAELRGKTLGIVGFGRVGRAVARRAAAFQMHILATDPNIPTGEIARQGAESAPWEQLLARSDYLTLHAPLLPDTRCVIDAEAIAAMKDGARLINTARGALIDENALAAALQRGKLAGAAVDVYRHEPPQGSPLIGLPNVVHTPHLGASTQEAQEAVAVQAARQIIDALTAGTFRNVVNPG